MRKKMRRLVIFRGPQGSGKSYLVTTTGLSQHVVNPDAIRAVVSGGHMSEDGRMRIASAHDSYVWQLAIESVERRMEYGETIAFDATLWNPKDINKLLKLAEAQRYQTLIVDGFKIDAETAFQNNQDRHPYARVPEDAIKRTIDLAAQPENSLDKLKNTFQNAFQHVYAHNDNGSFRTDVIKDIAAFLQQESNLVSLDNYERIVHIGDIQGCVDPLNHPQSPTFQGLSDDTFYIFHGDLLDRGPQNGQVAIWYMRNAHNRPNVRLIGGNHETHLELESMGAPAISQEFKRRTLPQLKQAGITQRDIEAIIDDIVPIFNYQYGDAAVQCSHAGFPRWISNIDLVPEQQLRHGAGSYNHRIDQLWSEWAVTPAALQEINNYYNVEKNNPSKTIKSLWQVHGHRNPHMLPTNTTQRSFCLEGQVEFGGHMRFAILSKNGWNTVDIRSKNYRRAYDTYKISKTEPRNITARLIPVAPWIKRGEINETPIHHDVLNSLRTHHLVNEKASESLPHIASLNFSKKAFFDASWDNITTQTRGLFVDMTNRVTVARSYPKFFNTGEHPETSYESLQNNLVFPVTIYNKENGFLGISGYDPRSEQLIMASKSRIDGEFADIFRDIAKDVLGDDGLERLLRFNRDQIASCVFEVIDPVRDPHIIAYQKPTIILLAAIRRHENFEQMPYEDLLKLAKHLGCQVKERLFVLDNFEALKNVVNRFDNIDLKLKNELPAYLANGRSEGLVVEDATGFQFKRKSAYYAFWKFMRSSKDRILYSREKGAEFNLDPYENNPTAYNFINFCLKLPNDILRNDIIWLREQFLNGVPVAKFNITQMPDKSQDFSGFLKGVSAIAEQLANGEVNILSVQKVIQRADASPEIKKAFDAHPAAALLRRIAA